MNNYVIALLLVICSFPLDLSAQKIKINFIVSNIQAGNGSVVLIMYNKKEQFFKSPFLSKTLKANNGTQDFIIEVPAGVYAILIFQDLDNDGKLKLGWLNIPKEPVGFGNNFRPKMSKPKFSDCAVAFKEQDTTISIKLY